MTSEISSQPGGYLSGMIESVGQCVDSCVSRLLPIIGGASLGIILATAVVGNRMGFVSRGAFNRVMAGIAASTGLIGANQAGLISGRSVALIAGTGSIAYIAGTNQQSSTREAIQEARQGRDRAKEAISQLDEEHKNAREVIEGTKEINKSVKLVGEQIEKNGKQIEKNGEQIEKNGEQIGKADEQIEKNGGQIGLFCKQVDQVLAKESGKLSSYRARQVKEMAIKTVQFSKNIETSTHDELKVASRGLCQDLKIGLKKIVQGERRCLNQSTL